MSSIIQSIVDIKSKFQIVDVTIELKGGAELAIIHDAEKDFLLNSKNEIIPESYFDKIKYVDGENNTFKVTEGENSFKIKFDNGQIVEKTKLLCI